MRRECFGRRSISELVAGVNQLLFGADGDVEGFRDAGEIAGSQQDWTMTWAGR